VVEEDVWGIDRNRMAEDCRQATEATEARLSALKQVRALVEEARVHARNVGGLEGVRIDAQLRTTLREVDRQRYDLRASLPH
jgi:hypothetical protein